MANAKIKVRVDRKFIDKRTKKIHRAGEIISVTQNRYDEIISKDKTLVSVVEQ